MIRNLIFCLAAGLVALTSCASPKGARKPRTEMVGAYTEGHQVSKEEMTLFNETYKGKEKLTPVSVSTQVVAGTNYRFVCKNEKGKKVTVVIFKALPCNGGKAEVISIE